MMIEGSCHCQTVRWRIRAMPAKLTICNCSICRRYAPFWAYGHMDDDIHIDGPTQAYVPDKLRGFHSCLNCGCLTHWRNLHTDGNGHRRVAINMRLAEPEMIADLPIRRFDGLNRFEFMVEDGRRVRDLWV